MNIFRILASGKHKFREEFVSAVLAYILSPKMDHGLGTAFLDILLNRISEKSNNGDLKPLINQLQNKFREDLFNNQSNYPLVELEVPFPSSKGSKGFIDIVIRCDDWFILVENKILAESATKDQVKDQYEGFIKVLKSQEMSESKVLSIYLVPALGGGQEWRISQTNLDETDFETRPGDDISLITWQPTDDDNISIVGCIREMLTKESNGEIPPMSSEIKHLLLSLIDFSMGGFQGFPYDRTTAKKGATDKVKVSDILNREDEIFIGVQYGSGGTISKAWKNKGFLSLELNITEDDNRGWQYLSLNNFKIISQWAMEPNNNSLDGIDWKGKPFATQNLYRVAKSVGEGIYIGVQGGLAKLKSMSVEDIKARQVWEIRTDKKNAHWFSGIEFCQVLEDKGIFYD